MDVYSLCLRLAEIGFDTEDKTKKFKTNLAILLLSEQLTEEQYNELIALA